MGIFNFFKRKTEKLVPLDPELVRRDRQLKAVTEKLRARDAQIAHILADQRQERENEIEEDQQEILRQRLKDEQIKINKSKFGNPASLRKFFSNPELLKNTEIADKDDAIVFGKFGDLLFLESKGLALTNSEGKILSYGKNINNVIYKPGTFINQLKRGRILIPYDKDHNPAIDWEEQEISDIKYDSEEKVYKLTEEAKETAKNLLIQKDIQLRRLRDDFERVENINLGLSRENSELKRTVKMQKSQVESSNSELSIVMNQFSQFQQSYGDIQRKIASLTEVKAMYEDIINRQENVMKNLLEKFEEAGDKTNYRKALAEVKEIIDYAKTRLPQQVIIQEEKTIKKEEETK